MKINEDYLKIISKLLKEKDDLVNITDINGDYYEYREENNYSQFEIDQLTISAKELVKIYNLQLPVKSFEFWLNNKFYGIILLPNSWGTINLQKSFNPAQSKKHQLNKVFKMFPNTLDLIAMSKDFFDNSDEKIFYFEEIDSLINFIKEELK